MKGIVLAGGKATRLLPLTKITSKQLMPVYDKPMIFYPIQTLAKAGIKDILIIVSPEHAGHFLNLLGSGKEMGLNFAYEVQEEPRGLADSFIVGENFLGGDDVTMILGDNIFDDDFSKYIKDFQNGAIIFAKEVPDAKRYGVIEFDENHNVLSIIEKPENPKSNFAMVGIYILDKRAPMFAKNVKPSERGEIEITEVINQYREKNELKVGFVKGIWEDAGTFDSLLKVNNLVAERVKKGIL